VRPKNLDLEWAKANLIRVWRAQAPKRVLEAYDAAQQRTKRSRPPPVKPRSSRTV
jgi:hypothetical protein